jgi:hypothetical protein
MEKSDRIVINPAERFTRSLKEPNEFRAIIGQGIVAQACEAALVSMTMEGRSREELNGAIVFMDRLLNISEPQQEPKVLPRKTLTTYQ